jgi:hypothetical protein
MAEKHTIVLTAEVEVDWKIDNEELVTKLAKIYGIEIETTCNVKNNKMKLIEFVKDCNSGAGPSNLKSLIHKCG